MTFQSNPLTRDLIVLKNENAIARSVKNIVFTVPGEKPFNPEFGSRITDSLFENIDDITASQIETELRDSIERFEPRVSITSLRVNANIDENGFDVVLVYDIIGAEVLPQQLEFVLLPTR
jgi:phage baseplate assembly protein W|tara:strand:- start:181 stop:540 length:360 start_codon:yes stop_codon:yes gene_type:complete